MTGWYIIGVLTLGFMMWGIREVRQSNDFQDEDGGGNKVRWLADCRTYLNKPESLVSILTLLAVAYYTYITQEILDATQHSYVDVQRAFVVVSIGNYYYYPHGEGIQAQITNSGNTPTRNLETYRNWLLRRAQIDQSFAFPDLTSEGVATRTPPLIHSLIGPKASIYSDTYIYDTPTMEAINSGKLFAYLYGWAKYEDILSATTLHITHYCFQIAFFTGKLDTPDADTRVWTRPCDSGNCADDECRVQGLL